MAIRQGYAEIASPKRENHNHNLKYIITMKTLSAEELHQEGVRYYYGNGVKANEEKPSSVSNKRLPSATCHNQNMH